MYYRKPANRSSLYWELKQEISHYKAVYGLIFTFIIVQIIVFIFPPALVLLGFTPRLFLWGFYWTIITHMFVHYPYIIPFHLIMNSIALYYVGRYTEILMGSKLTFIAFLISGIFGGLLTLLMAYILPLVNPLAVYLPDQVSIGASGAIFGLFAIIAADRPNSEILFFLFIPLLPIIIPIRARGKTLLMILIGMELIFGLLAIPGDFYGHFSHLGGMICGFLLYKHYLWKKIYQRAYGVAFYGQ